VAIVIDDNEEIYKLAVVALERMRDKHGASLRFPPDAIWQHLPPNVEILSTKKPHQAKRLVREGYIQETGAKTRAQSGPRAGSPTSEYRFGSKLNPEETKMPGPGASNNPTPESCSNAIAAIQGAMESEGYLVSSAELANFLLAMTVSPLVILSGISGTGKSLLPRKFAKLTGSHFTAIPVQPQWADNSDLFGYVPSLASSTFTPGKIIPPLLHAKNSPESLTIVLLDEMNLAPVEHYFSDFLSVAESCARNEGRIRSDPLPLDLPSPPSGDNADPYAALRGLELPHNLRVVGTANMDETTHSFSPKVLDRAFTIEFDDPDLTSFASVNAHSQTGLKVLANAIIDPTRAVTVQEAKNDSQDLFEFVVDLLVEVQAILSPAGVKFGYRTRDSILLYLHFWRKLNLSERLAGCAALDFCILQKILPKISGSGEALQTALRSLSAWLGSREESNGSPGLKGDFEGPLARSQAKVNRMLSLLEEEGSTRYWGA
jgi:MoxR-like ATPase